MRLFLLPVPGRGLSFYFEPDPESRTVASPGDDLIARTKTRILQIYSQIEKHFPIAERISRRLRRAASVEIIHPPTVAEDEAQRRFTELLRSEFGKQLIWTAVDTTLALLSIPLALLPGPNIIFYFFAARAFTHIMALQGISGYPKRLERGQARLESRSEERLARLEELILSGQVDGIDELGRQLGLSQLCSFYQRACKGAGWHPG